MAAEINKQDIFSDDALQAPLVMAKNLEITSKALENLLVISKKSEGAIGGAKTSQEAIKATKELTAVQSELEKIQKSYAASTSKLSDEYVSNKRALNAVNQEVKEKIALSDKDSKLITAQNASYRQLGDALAKNRRLYQELNSDTARSSAQGKELLKVIQDQDKQYKALADDMKISQVHVGNYEKAMGRLNMMVGGAIESFKGLGKEFMALAMNPWIAVAAALAATFVALKDAAHEYYTSTLKGEEQLKEEMLKDEAFAKVYKSIWEKIGGFTAQVWENAKNEYKSYVFLLSSRDVQKQIIETQNLAKKAAEENSKNFKDHIRDVVDDARTEMNATELLATAKDKLGKTEFIRLESLREAQYLLDEQLKGDLELAQQDIDTEVTRLRSLGKVIDGKKLLADYTDQEIMDTKLTGAELTKLAQLQAALMNTQTAANEKRKGFYKQEAALIGEIQKELADAAKEKKRLDDEEAKRMKEQADIKYKEDVEREKEEIRLKTEHDKEEADMDKVRDSNKKAAFDKWVKDAQDSNAKVSEASQKRFDEDKKRIEDEKQARMDLFNLLSDYVNVTANAANTIIGLQASQSANAILGYQNEIAVLQEKSKKEIELAGNNDDAKKELQKREAARTAELNKKIAAEKTKQAQLQHQADIIRAGVVFAQAILVALAGGPPPFNLALAEITAAVAGLQLAAIIASPVPKFAGGTTSAPGGLAIIGEKGMEAVKVPGKSWTLSPSSATLTNLPRGSEVVPHKETMQRLAMAGISSEAVVNQENFELYGQMKTMVKTIQDVGNRTVAAIEDSKSDLVAQGSLIYEVKKKGDANRQLIRRKSMSE